MVVPMCFAANSARTLSPSAALALLVGILLAYSSMPVQAESWQWRPEFKLQQGYDDNIRLLTDESDEGFETSAEAALSLVRLTEISEVSGRLKAEYVAFSDNDELDDETIFYADLDGFRRLSERSSVGLALGYRRDYTESERQLLVFDEQDELFLDPDIAVVEEQVRRNRVTVAPSWDYALSETTNTHLGYRFTNVDHSDEADPTELTDYRRHHGEGQLSNRWTERTTVNLTAMVDRYIGEFTVDPEETSYGLVGGIEHRWSEVTTLDAFLGWRHSRVEIDSGTEEDDGILVGASAHRRLETGFWRIRAERRVEPSGTGGFLERDLVGFRYRQDFTERWGGWLRSSYFETERVFGPEKTTTNRRYLLIEPGFDWVMTPRWQLDLFYRYRRQEREGESGSAESNAVFVAIEFSPLVPD